MTDSHQATTMDEMAGGANAASAEKGKGKAVDESSKDVSMGEEEASEDDDPEAEVSGA